MIVDNKTKNNNKLFIYGKGIVKMTKFVHSNVHSVQQVQLYIEHNPNKIDDIQIKDKNVKEVKELNKTSHVNNKLYLTKLGGGFVKLNWGD